MQANKGRDTVPELLVRRALHNRGLRFRVNYPPIKGLRRTADIVFTRVRVAVFIDGCFWHGCPEHYQAPMANAGYWVPKIEANRERDAATMRQLDQQGWTALRFWEHDARQNLDAVVAAIESAVHRGRL